jgi:hypothetical protein
MDSLPIIIKTYEAYKGIVAIADALPKRRKYSLGVGLENTILDCLSQFIMAKNAPKPMKGAYLLKASSLVEIAILKLRLCLELKFVNETKIFQIQSMLAEIGRMLGGWIKATQSK